MSHWHMHVPAADDVLSAIGVHQRAGISRTGPISGVMIFRKTPAARDLFASWHEEWKRFNGRDQMALVRAPAGDGRAGASPARHLERPSS